METICKLIVSYIIPGVIRIIELIVSVEYNKVAADSIEMNALTNLFIYNEKHKYYIRLIILDIFAH